MSNNVFPTLSGIEWNIERNPIHNTLIAESASGKEATCALWSFPKYQYKLSYSVLNDNTTSDLKTIIGFFNEALGQYDSWLYTDPSDYTVVAQAIGTGDGSTTAFQLLRTRGGFVEPIQNINGTPSVYVNGILQNYIGDYYMGPTGIIHFGNPPANALPITATFSWYWRCRFSADTMTFNQFMKNLWESKSVKFQTVKL